MKKKLVNNRYGEVIQISKDQWVHEVTEASKTCTVIVFLYQDSIIDCNIMDEALITLSNKFKDIKFTKIKSTSAVENWPDYNLPTLFIYKDSQLIQQLLTLKQVHGKSMTPLDLEWWLVCKDIIKNSELEEDPRA